MDDVGWTEGRERTVGIVSFLLPLAGIALFIAASNGAIGDHLRGLVGPGGSDERVRPAVETDAAGSHGYLNTQRGSREPVGFSPCREIHYVVNPTGAPAGWEGHVDAAVSEVEARTGLAMTYDGTTDDRDFTGRLDADPKPVLIGWAVEDEVGVLADDVAGVGGPTMVEIGGRRTYVTGSVVLDSDTTARMSRMRDGDDLQVALLLHELGHLVGLDHVEDEGELMFPLAITRTTYGPGDLEGLAALGSVDCT